MQASVAQSEYMWIYEYKCGCYYILLINFCQLLDEEVLLFWVKCPFGLFCSAVVHQNNLGCGFHIILYKPLEAQSVIRVPLLSESHSVDLTDLFWLKLFLMSRKL